VGRGGFDFYNHYSRAGYTIITVKEFFKIINEEVKFPDVFYTLEKKHKHMKKPHKIREKEGQKHQVGAPVHWHRGDYIYLNVKILEYFKDSNAYKLRGFDDVAFEDELYTGYQLNK